MISVIEKYLTDEGLLNFIDPTRKKSLLSTPPNIILAIWFIGTLISSLLVTFYQSPPMNILKIGIWYFILLIIFVIFLIVPFIKDRITKSKELDETKLINRSFWFIIIFPILVSVLVGLVNSSWIAFIIQLLISFALFIFMGFVATSYFPSIFFHIFRASFNIIGRSLNLLISLFPILLTIIILSVFSQDFWLILGNLSWYQIFGLTLILFIPPLALNYLKASDIVDSFFSQISSHAQIIDIFRNIDVISNEFEQNNVSDNEWKHLREDLQWRNLSKLKETNLNKVKKAATRRTLLFIELVNLLLMASFFSYFLFLFLIIFDPEIISNWANLTSPTSFIWRFEILPGYEAMFKVSFVLASLIAITSRVSTFSDSTFKDQILGWIALKSNQWVCSAIMYEVLLHPKFQFWKTRVNNENIFNVNIVVKPGLSETEVRQACEAMTAKAQTSTYFHMVTAFEYIEGVTEYDFGYAHEGKRLQLLVNKSKGITKFQDMSLDLEGDLRFSHDLGLLYLEQNISIPDKWFGEDHTEVELGKEIWESDSTHELFYHPYVYKAKHYYCLEIRLAKRLRTSDEYRSLTKEILQKALEHISDHKMLTIVFSFRDSVETISKLDYMLKVNQITYKDQYTNKIESSSPAKWLTK